MSRKDTAELTGNKESGDLDCLTFDPNSVGLGLYVCV